jgi:uncharacterized membrane protein (DUF2068 family)
MSAPVTKVAPWEDFVLRFIAIYKLCHALFFIAVGFGLIRLRGHMVTFLNNYIIIPYHLNPEDRLGHWLLVKADVLTSHRLLLLGYAAFFYAALFAIEGIGLYLRKHWAEYVVVLVTGSLLPLEIYELYLKLAWWKFAAVAGNILIVSYLVHRLLLDARTKRAAREKLSAPQSPANTRAKSVPAEVP